jgi:vacuolar-type H+-ATPase subunit H
MEREEVVREDFPTARKGWDPDAVRAHLESLLARFPSSPSGLGDAAGERVATIVAAAESTAAEIEAEARERAERTLSEARSEAERILAEARTEAESRLERAQGAVEGLVGQAESLRAQIGSLGESLTDDLRERAAAVSAEISPPAEPGPEPPVPTPDPGPPVPEPDPGPPVPEPDPGPPVPEPDPGPPAPDPDPGPATPDPPQPDPGPPTPDPAPDPGTPEPPPAPEPPTDPEPGPPAPGGEEVSTEDLIAQLRGDGAGAAANGGVAEAAAEPVTGAEGDAAAARLVAMNLALEGVERDEIVARLGAEFGALLDADGLVDDVLSRTGRG